MSIPPPHPGRRQAATRRFRRLTDALFLRSIRSAAVCGRCGDPIDYSVPRGSTDLSFTYGHIVEVDAGGDVFDPNNGRPEHRVCNLTAGAEYAIAKRRNAQRPIKSSRRW